GASVHWSPARGIPQEDAREPAGDLLGDLVEIHLPAGAGGTFDGERVAVEDMVLEQRPDDQAVHGHPNGSAPVGGAAEHAGVGCGREVGHAVFLVPDTEDVGMLGMVARESPDTVGAQELLLVEHPGEHPAKLSLVQDRSESAALMTWLRRVVNEAPHLRTRIE